MVETTLNVWSDSCVANMINKTHQFDLDDEVAPEQVGVINAVT
jgi:hypothetical protein